MSMRSSSAFQTLVALDAYCRQGGSRLPAQKEAVPTVSVICFVLDQTRYAVPFADVVELLESPPCTRLPRVQDWVRGVANVRGRLLPIIDLAAFCGSSLTSAPKQQRVMVMDKHGVFVGLLVDEIVGMRHFPVDTFVEDAGTENVLSPYLEGGFRDGNRVWGLFRFAQLAGDMRFMNVTA